MFIKKPIHRPDDGEALAELIGILLGDGHLSRKQIEVVLESPCEAGFAVNFSCAIKDMFGVIPRIKVSTLDNSLKIRVNSVSIVEFLLSKGMTIGDKIKNNVGIPKFILDDDDLLAPCIRGLIDTDGGIFSKDKISNRAIIEFENRCTRLLGDVRFGLAKLGFTPSKSGASNRLVRAIRIQKQDEVKRFIREIGFNNPKNLLKSQIFLKSGFIPSTKEIKLIINEGASSLAW